MTPSESVGVGFPGMDAFRGGGLDDTFSCALARVEEAIFEHDYRSARAVLVAIGLHAVVVLPPPIAESDSRVAADKNAVALTFAGDRL